MSPYLQDPDFTLYVGDVLEVLPQLEAGSVDCVITSPPYWGLRDYAVDGQLGLEATPDQYVRNMVAVFREVRRVLAPHGTCWINLGDSYTTGGSDWSRWKGGQTFKDRAQHNRRPTGVKPKDLVGIPWRVAFALQADGWYLRSDIIWAKPNPMPESVTDRPTKAHEYVFLLTRQPRYWFDAEAVREANGHPNRSGTNPRLAYVTQPGNTYQGRDGRSIDSNPTGRNIRSVWEIPTQPYPEAHFATYPQELVRRALLAGCPEWVCRTCGKPRERIVETSLAPATRPSPPNKGNLTGFNERAAALTANGWVPNREKTTTTLGWSDCGHNNHRPGLVLDPFLGSGTTALVARHHGRRTIGIELSPAYAELAAQRLQQLSLLAEIPA